MISKALESNSISIQKPYSLSKGRIRSYRLIFGHIAAVFILLSLIVFFRSPNWICNLYMGHCLLLKGIIGSFSSFLGIAAMLIGLWLRTEWDTAFKIDRQAKAKLRRLYRQKLELVGGTLAGLFPKDPKQAKEVTAAYLETKHRLIDLHEKNALLLRQIAYSQKSQLMKEALFDETLRDYSTHCSEIVDGFATLRFEGHPGSV